MATTILIVDDEDNFRDGMVAYLSKKGYETYGASNLTEARNELNQTSIDIILLDVQIGSEFGPDLLSDTALIRPSPKVIIITAYGEVDIAVSAMKNGAFDFLSKPIDFKKLEHQIIAAEEQMTMIKELNEYAMFKNNSFDFVMGQTPVMKQVFLDAAKAARAGVTVLINGETGTGKEIVAKYVHMSGNRAKKPCVPINCAAFQPAILESELFGHEVGSFTGAVGKKPGLFEVADGGILFLDEISSMSLDMQAKILRALEDKKIRHVGGTKEISVDVQVVSASNKDLIKMIENGTFREDLYYRLRLVDIFIPPLRERLVDIPELTGFFIKNINRERGLNVTDVSPQVIQAFMDYSWPGNLRELRNALERACVFCNNGVIEIGDISRNIIDKNHASESSRWK